MADVWRYGEALRDARKKKRLSQDDAARAVGVKLGAWGAWERGTAIPAHERLPKIVEVLEVEPAAIGYEPPANMELVGSEYIRRRLDEMEATLREILLAVGGNP